MSAKVDCDSSKKSVIWAYLLWMFGGIFGVHHFYLKRDRHAFVWWTTLGGFGVGWLGEIFRIPRYVRDANEEHPECLKARMQQSKKVSCSLGLLPRVKVLVKCVLFHTTVATPA